jgi:hypothetical protein
MAAKKPRVVIVRFWSSAGPGDGGEVPLYCAIRVVDGVRGFEVIDGDPTPDFLEELRTRPIPAPGGLISPRAGIAWAMLIPATRKWAEVEIVE